MFGLFEKNGYKALKDHKEWQEATSQTNDVWWLEQFEYQWVFVYNDGMSTHKGYIEGVKFFHAHTKRDYLLYRKELGDDSYAIALRSRLSTDNVPPWMDVPKGMAHKVKGELWLVRPPVIFSLDKAMDNGHTFLRKRITVQVPCHREMDGQAVLKQVQAWTYVGNPEIWRDLVKEGQTYKLCPVFRPANPLLSTYYYFSRDNASSNPVDLPRKSEGFFEEPKVLEFVEIARAF